MPRLCPRELPLHQTHCTGAETLTRRDVVRSEPGHDHGRGLLRGVRILSILVRGRSDDDLDRCVEIARAVRQLDGYPPYLPGDLRSFIVSSAIGAWVAELDGEVVGHVALHRRSSPPVMALASAATGQPPGRLGVVARLAVAPETRRRGVGGALLAAAASAAVRRGLSPVLDVAKQFGAAVSLYGRCGWACAGEVVVNLGDRTLEEYVFIGPAP